MRLTANKIRTEGIVAMGEALKVNSTVCFLDLFSDVKIKGGKKKMLKMIRTVR